MDDDIRGRAAALADDIATGVEQGRPVEWVEELVGTALLEVARLERDRCAALAERRAEMWQSTGERYASGSWPREAVTEARERRKEALVLADAIRVDAPPLSEKR